MSETPSTDSRDDALISRVRRSASASDYTIDSVILLPKHGSARRYARTRTARGDTRVVMLLPESTGGTHEIGATSYDKIGESPFVRVQRVFSEKGIRVPEIYGVDEDNRVLWLEDLGSRDLDQAQREQADNQKTLYGAAVDLLLDIQSIDLADCPASVRESRFSVEHFEWELEHYVEWRLEKRLNVDLKAKRREQLREEFRQLSRELHDIPVVCAHRDYQSHNLMVGDDGELVAIDFQDALVAPVVYDLVALLRDSYVVLDDVALRELFERWFRGASGSVLARSVSLAQAWRWFRLQTIQRKLKDTGRFEYFALHDGNDGFLRYLSDSVGYVRGALEEFDSYPVLKDTLARYEPFYSQPQAGEA